MALSSTPIFATADVTASVAYYVDALGFRWEWGWGEPPTIASVAHGSVSIMLSLQPDLASQVAGHQHWFRVDDADALHADHLARGAKILEPPSDRPWGVREYVVEDPSGYHLRFAGPPKGEAKPSDPFPSDVTIELRLPTPAEYETIARDAFYRDGTTPSVLDHSWGGVVALGPEGIIGMARVMFDAPGWYSVWDVAVLPDWQGRHIGHRLMEEALAMVGEASPGAWVFLFTYKHGFYEKLGFNLQSVSMRQA